LAQLIEFAIRYNKPVRIGANWGSLDQSLAARLMDENALRAEPWDAGRVMREALIRSALDSAHRAVEIGLPAQRIVLSAKVSGVQELVAVYRDLATRSDFALHLGLTEAGIGSKGIVASSAALAVLLQEGIGDTIRISLTPEPGASRTQEVIVAQELLQTLGLRAFTPMVTACPGCGRTTSEFFQELAGVVQNHVRAEVREWKTRHPGRAKTHGGGAGPPVDVWGARRGLRGVSCATRSSVASRAWCSTSSTSARSTRTSRSRS